MPWGVANYNVNPALNVSINGIDIAELCSAAGYNDALRQIMADIATWTSASGVTYPISIGQGGTGQITAPLALAALGGLGVAYKGLPPVTKAASFDFDTTMEGGKVVYTGAAATGTIQPATLTADGIIVIVNDGSAALAIARGAGVALIWSATGADANRSLAVGGVATIMYRSLNRFFISGSGLS
jgi:hypothetical protein